MKVHKRTKVNVGDGSPQDIINALLDYEGALPAKARATDVEIDFSSVNTVGLLSSSSTPLDVLMTFEWTNDE